MKPEKLVVCPEPGCNSTTFLIDADDGSIVCAVCGKQYKKVVGLVDK